MAVPALPAQGSTTWYSWAQGIHTAVTTVLDVRNYGATGNGTTDDTTAIQAAITALPASGGTMYFPPGIYLISGTLDFGAKPGVKVAGEGKPGQNAVVGMGATVIKYTGTDWALKWAAGAATVAFNGIHIEGIHFQGTTGVTGGVWLGNAANSLIRDCAFSEFKNGTTTAACIRVGEGATYGSQYNTLDNITASASDIAVDIYQSNGTRIIGGNFEDTMPTPRTGTYGVRIRSGGDTTTLIGTVIQGFDTLLDIAGTGTSCTAVRCEGFATAAYNIPGQKVSVIGGSINNGINGSVGTGVVLTSTSLACLLLTATVSSVATKLTDAGTKNTYIIDPDGVARIEPGFLGLETAGLRVNKEGAGAQDPTASFESNGTVGPVLGTADSFVTMVLDHTWANATRGSFRLRGVEALAIGPTNAVGFHGSTPTTKPAITGSRGGNAALASLLTQLATKGLITDSTTA